MQSAVRTASQVLAPQSGKLTCCAPISSGVAQLQRPQLKLKYQPDYETADPFMEQQQVKPLPGQITIQSFQPCHVPAVLNVVMTSYLDTTPLNRAVGLERDEAQGPYREKIEDCASKGDSFMAVDQESGKIVGVILNEKLVRGRYRYTSHYPAKLEKIAQFLRHVEGDQFAHLHPANSLFQLQDAVVVPGYQNHGIAKQLIAMSVGQAAAQGCDYMTATATSPLYHRILRENIGFSPVRSCDTMTYTDPETQERPFQCIAHSSPQVTFMARKLDTSRDHKRHQLG